MSEVIKAMKRMTKFEFMGLDTENVVGIEIKDGNIKLIVDVEAWEECIYESDRYRIRMFVTDFVNKEWTLDKDVISQKGLFNAISEKSSEMCGGIVFAHEEDREAENVFEDIIEFMVALCESPPKIISCSSQEFSGKFNELEDGSYLLVIE